MPNHIMKHASFCNAIIILSKRSISMNENAAKNLRKLFYIWNNDWIVTILGVPFETIVVPSDYIIRRNCKNFIFHIHSNDSLLIGISELVRFDLNIWTNPDKPVLNDGGEANGKSIFVIVTITIVWRIICRAWIRIATLIGLTLLSDWSDYSSNENHAWEDNHRHLYHYHNQRNR